MEKVAIEVKKTLNESNIKNENNINIISLGEEYIKYIIENCKSASEYYCIGYNEKAFDYNIDMNMSNYDSFYDWMESNIDCNFDIDNFENFIKKYNIPITCKLYLAISKYAWENINNDIIKNTALKYSDIIYDARNDGCPTYGLDDEYYNSYELGYIQYEYKYDENIVEDLIFNYDYLKDDIIVLAWDIYEDSDLIDIDKIRELCYYAIAHLMLYYTKKDIRKWIKEENDFIFSKVIKYGNCTLFNDDEAVYRYVEMYSDYVWEEMRKIIKEGYLDNF